MKNKIMANLQNKNGKVINRIKSDFYNLNQEEPQFDVEYKDIITALTESKKVFSINNMKVISKSYDSNSVLYRVEYK